jgi:DNA-binding NarL/FixJ family response regulator
MKQNQPVNTEISMSKPEVKLTPRELDVVRLIVSGLRYREIAEELGLSHETIKTYVGRIRKKLSVDSKTKIAMWAVRSGLE